MRRISKSSAAFICLTESISGIAYDAAADFSDELSGAIALYEMEEGVPFTPAFLSGFYADAGDVDSNVYRQDACELVTEEGRKSGIRCGKRADGKGCGGFARGAEKICGRLAAFGAASVFSAESAVYHHAGRLPVFGGASFGSLRGGSRSSGSRRSGGGGHRF